MALSFLDNVDYRGKKPNFTRDLFETLSDMKSFSELYLPDMFIACCKETGKLYLFNRENDFDAILGRWREYSGGNAAGTGVLTNPIEFKTNVGGIEAGTIFPIGTSIESILEQLGGKIYLSDSLFYYGVLNNKEDNINLNDLSSTESSGLVTIKITSDNQYIVFVSEKVVTEIKDSLGLPNNSEFTETQKTINGKSYYIYISNNLITCADFAYTIKN